VIERGLCVFERVAGWQRIKVKPLSKGLALGLVHDRGRGTGGVLGWVIVLGLVRVSGLGEAACEGGGRDEEGRRLANVMSVKSRKRHYGTQRAFLPSARLRRTDRQRF
jgi:hypothetical protein